MKPNILARLLAALSLALVATAATQSSASALPCQAAPNRICSVCSSLACYP